jgi:hypothetical protein
MLLIFANNMMAGPGFVGSKVCASCHRSIYNSFIKTSMGRSLGEVTPDLKLALPGRSELKSSTPGHAYQVFWENGQLYQSESFLNSEGSREQGGKFRADYIVGSGTRGYTFLFRRDNRLFEAPVSFYSRTHNWDLSPGFDAYDAGFARPARIACLECHLGRFVAGVQADATLPMQPFAEESIGCENCHGPGEMHVKARGSGKAATSTDDPIVNPARLAKPLENAICLRCHQGNDARVFETGKTLADFRPGTPLNQTVHIFKVPLGRDRPPAESDLLEHGFAMMLSKCYRVSGQMTCTSCHVVHRNIEPAKKVTFYRARCLACHTVKDCRLRQEARRPDDNCVACHMPKRPVATVSHTALTNHRIVRNTGEPFPEEAYTESAGSPGLIDVSLALDTDGKDVSPIVLLQAYQMLLTQALDLRNQYLNLLERLRFHDAENPIVLAAAGHELGSIPLLQKAWQSMEADTDVCLDLADALRKAHRENEAVLILKEGVKREPYERKLHQALIALTLDSANDADSLKLMQDYLKIFPTDNRVRTLVRELSGRAKR